MKHLITAITIVVTLLSMSDAVSDITQADVAEPGVVSTVGTVYETTDKAVIFDIEGQLYRVKWSDVSRVKIGETYSLDFEGDELVNVAFIKQ